MMAAVVLAAVVAVVAVALIVQEPMEKLVELVVAAAVAAVTCMMTPVMTTAAAAAIRAVRVGDICKGEEAEEEARGAPVEAGGLPWPAVRSQNMRIGHLTAGGAER